MKKLILFVIFATALFCTGASAIPVVFDYSYDTGGFFTPDRKNVVNLAASSFSGLAIDRGSIAPGGSDTWTWQFDNPTTGLTQSVVDPTIGAGELRVYLGARDLGGSTLGLGGSVGWSASGSSPWINTLQNTNTSSAYKPFAGSISLSSTTTWYSGIGETVTPGEFDLYSVIAHELGHVLGIGMYGYVDAWNANVNSSLHTFIGASATLAYGGAIPLETDHAHFTQGTTSGGNSLIMVPAITPGTRRHWTAPELAAFVDMGFLPIPEPASLLLLVWAALLFKLWARKGFRIAY